MHIILYKTEVQDVFGRFTNRAMTNYGVKIKHIRSDNGMKFKNTSLNTYLDTLGITHELSSPYTPQQNGVVERKNRTLIEMARTMLDEYKTPRKFWPEAIDTACHIINRVYLHKFFKKTSYHYCRMLLTRHYDQRPFDERMCDALIANGDVKNRQKSCKTFAMAETSNTVQILVTCAMRGIRLIQKNCLR